MFIGDDDASLKLYTVYEATSGNISMISADQSDKKRPVSIRIQSIPRHGNLYDPITGLQLFNGSLVNTSSTYPYESAIMVLYLGNKNYFNSPTVRYNGTALSFNEGDDDSNYEGETGKKGTLFYFII